MNQDETHSHHDLNGEVKRWVLRLWWTPPVPFSLISCSSEGRGHRCVCVVLQLHLGRGTATAKISPCFWGSVWDIFRGSCNQGLSLVLFNQSSAGWVKINGLWVLALTGAYSSQSSAPLPPNVTFNEPISPQWRGRHFKLLFTPHSLLISHS